MKTLIRVGCTLVAAAILAHEIPAWGDAVGAGVLAQMDAAMNKAKTLKLEYEIVNKEAPDKAERTLGMKVLIKGQKRFSEFTAPADMKGTKVLVLSPTQMYVYLPAFGKVRRITSHTQDQGFLGMAFSLDDLATTAYGQSYTAVVDSEDATTWKLVLTPKVGQQTPYAKIAVIVLKNRKLPSELKYFDADGKNVKTETRTGNSCEGDVCTPGELRMIDNVKGTWTKLVAKSREVNKEISDDVFTQRNLGE